MLMVGFRKVLVQGLAALLFIILLGGAYAVSLNHTLGKPATVETSLRNSGVYNQIASYAINRASDVTGAPAGSVSLNNPQVQAIAKSVFSEQLVQQNAETFINSNYRWLNGATVTPDFTLDLSSAKQSFASRIGQTVLDYLSKLPVCTPAQLVQLQSLATVDPLTISCRPATVQPQAEASRVVNQILSSNFLTQPVVTANTLKINGQSEQNKPYYEKFSKAPQVYQLLQKAPLIFGILALITALGVIFIAPVRRKGVRRVGLTFTLVGILLIATKFVSDTLFNKLETKVFTGAETTDVQKPLIDAAHQLEKQLVTVDLYIGIVFVIIGLALVALYFKMRSASKGTPGVPQAMVEPTQPVLPVEPTATVRDIQLARPAKGPTMDIARPKKPQQQAATPAKPVTADQTAEPAPPVPKKMPRPRSRLIQ
ncbi:MAG: hypothetical protein JWO35_921 [Candidatus Saccharibacteria bacterium]|nr:hypothetical protein [Candidatus Saccharibacteria bacterium]